MHSPADFPKAYKLTVEAADEAAFLALYEEEIHVFDLWDEWSLAGISAWRSMAKEWFGSLGQEKLKVSFDETAWKEDGNLAFLTSFICFAAQDSAGKELRSLSERITVIFRRQKEGGWKVMHQHTSAPINSQNVSAILKRA